MTRSVRFEHEAALELLEAARWYHQRRIGLGSEFIDAVDAALDVVRRWPNAAPRRPGLLQNLNVRRAPVPRFPYGIIYVAIDDTIRVLAIAHDSREPFYWLNAN